MCIRDRLITLVARIRGLARNGSDELEARRAQRLLLVLLDVCLLYTSDAADERSSVDLGGRRIIKKKKKRSGPEHTHTSIITTAQQSSMESTCR